jgi:hypothetical protein
MVRLLALLATGGLAACTVITSPGDYEDGDPLDDGGFPGEDMATRCTGDADCPSGVCVDGACVECRDSGECSVDLPACVDGSCARCRDAGDCESFAGTPVCDDEGACVGCLADSDCTDPSAARCDMATQECVPCDAPSQCEGTGLTLCAEGTCVECTTEDETPCGDFSCDPADNTCTTTQRGTVSRCGACVADSECGLADDRCVPMEFMGEPREGGYCLKRGATGCVQPYNSPTPERASLSGAAPEAYCGILEDRTTCEAVLDLIASTSCATAEDCGAEGVADARCESVNMTPNKCTYDCGVAADCPSSTICGAAGAYCGAPNT